MIVVSDDGMAAKTAGPLRDPELLVPPPPYQQVDVRRGGPSTEPREPSPFSAGPSTASTVQSRSPGRSPNNPYLSVPSNHRRDFSTASVRSLSPYAPSHDDALTRFASTPALVSPSSPIAQAEFTRGTTYDPAHRQLDRTARGFKLPTSSDGLAALLNPPPPSFERPRAAGVSYTPFEPTSLLGISSDLTRTFPRMAPPCANAAEHPFATHDVTEQDWSRFLRDLEAASALSKWERIITRVNLPSVLAMSVGLVVKGVEVYMHSKRRGPVGELIRYWNHVRATVDGVLYEAADDAANSTSSIRDISMSSLPGAPKRTLALIHILQTCL